MRDQVISKVASIARLPQSPSILRLFPVGPRRGAFLLGQLRELKRAPGCRSIGTTQKVCARRTGDLKRRQIVRAFRNGAHLKKRKQKITKQGSMTFTRLDFTTNLWRVAFNYIKCLLMSDVFFSNYT